MYFVVLGARHPIILTYVLICCYLCCCLMCLCDYICNDALVCYLNALRCCYHGSLCCYRVFICCYSIMYVIYCDFNSVCLTCCESCCNYDYIYACIYIYIYIFSLRRRLYPHPLSALQFKLPPRLFPPYENPRRPHLCMSNSAHRC